MHMVLDSAYIEINYLENYVLSYQWYRTRAQKCYENVKVDPHGQGQM